MRTQVIGADGEAQPDPPSRLRQLVDAAATDDRVQEVLHYLGSEPTWYGLYKAYEIVRPTGDGNLFTHTAQMHRHHNDYCDAPQDPMPLGDAISFVRGLVTDWLETRVPRGDDAGASVSL